MKRVLIVEDFESNRAWIREMIELLYPEVQVLEAPNGREGVTLALVERPDLIILDTNMPLMDGYETARALNALPQTQTIPLIGMTLVGNEHSSTLAYLRPFCQSVLLKPFNAAQLGAALGTALRQSLV